MPASTTALSVLSSGSPRGIALSEEDADTSPGNKFKADPKTFLYARNSAGAVSYDLYFEADKFGQEVTLLTETMSPGEERIFGPFPPEFLDHGTTSPSDNGSVFVRPDSGADGTMKFVAFRLG